MKRILVILSILMITGVSAQKIEHLKAKTNTFKGTKILVQWDAKANSSRYRLKGTSEWQGGKNEARGNHTYGFTLPRDTTTDVTYQLSVGKDKKVIREISILKTVRVDPVTDVDNKTIYIAVYTKKDLNNLLNKTIYVGPGSVKGIVTTIAAWPGGGHLTIELDKSLSNDVLTKNNPTLKSFIWFKQ